MTIRTMRIDDLQTVLDWAAEEGWNPGLDDAAAFYAADPKGFLVKEKDGAPVAAISVVNHDTNTAFLGLYLCKHGHRGQGHGMDVWRAGIAHAQDRCIGLDGVPDQQQNYARSGFAKYGSTVRYEGHLASVTDPRIRAASPDDLSNLIAQDAKACGIERAAFATAWFAQAPTRQTMVLAEGSDITGFATFRRCRLGCKVGPLYARSEADARALLGANPFPTAKDPCVVDVFDQNAPLADVLRSLGFEATFETARMYSGAEPTNNPALFQAIATMELG